MWIFKSDKNRYWCGNGMFFFPHCVFHEACVLHDIMYRDVWYTNRRKVDYVFLQNMLIIANNNISHIILAYVFYAIVRLVWWFYFITNPNG